MSTKRNYSIQRLVLLTTLWLTLFGCATGGIQSSSDGTTKDVMRSFKDGELRLSCLLSCSMTSGFNAVKVQTFYVNSSWRKLVSEVARIGYEDDLAYFYLGRAAEELGYINSARIYYRLSINTVAKCDSLTNVCQGINVPDDVSSRLAKLQNKPDAVPLLLTKLHNKPDDVAIANTEPKVTNFISKNKHQSSTIFTIEDRIEATFSTQPSLQNNEQVSGQSFKQYRAVDIDNSLIYKLLIQIDSVIIENEAIYQTLSQFVNSRAIATSLDGRVTREDLTIHDGFKSVDFTIKYTQQGIPKRISGSVIYNEGYIYEWSVNDLPSRSKKDGSSVFNSSIKYLTLL